MRRRSRRAPTSRSSFADFRFPPDMIVSRPSHVPLAAGRSATAVAPPQSAIMHDSHRRARLAAPAVDELFGTHRMTSSAPTGFDHYEFIDKPTLRG